MPVGAVDGGGGLGEGQGCVRRAVGEPVQRRLVQVRYVVAGRVVALVVCHPGRAAVGRRFPGRLGVLGAAEEAAAGMPASIKAL